MEYELIKSRRKSISIKITEDGRIVVHAPSFMTKREVEKFLISKSDWIENTLKKVEKKQERLAGIDKLSEKEIKTLKNEARKEFTMLCDEYCRIMGLSYNKIAIRTQKSRWGSCSRDKNLNFNALLMLAPEGARRYVVVHELCHLREMNHSTRFWALVEQYCPNWKKERRWLKQNGSILIARLPD